MFAEGLWDKIIDTETVAALGHALSDEDWDIRASMVKFYAAAMTQGALHCFRGTFLSKYLQAVFGTRYLSLEPSPYSDMH